MDGSVDLHTFTNTLVASDDCEKDYRCEKGSIGVGWLTLTCAKAAVITTRGLMLYCMVKQLSPLNGAILQRTSVPELELALCNLTISIDLVYIFGAQKKKKNSTPTLLNVGRALLLMV